MTRVKVTLRLSDDARKGWDDAALRGGVTMTALVEAIGRTLREQKGALTNPVVLELARRIDMERRNRR